MEGASHPERQRHERGRDRDTQRAVSPLRRQSARDDERDGARDREREKERERERQKGRSPCHTRIEFSPANKKNTRIEFSPANKKREGNMFSKNCVLYLVCSLLRTRCSRRVLHKTWFLKLP
jgi:hypothetical protein